MGKTCEHFDYGVEFLVDTSTHCDKKAMHNNANGCLTIFLVARVCFHEIYINCAASNSVVYQCSRASRVILTFPSSRISKISHLHRLPSVSCPK